MYHTPEKDTIEGLQIQAHFVYQLLRQIMVRIPDTTLEVILMVALGPLFGAFTPQEVAKLLLLSSATLYRHIHTITVHRWKRLIQTLGYQKALPHLKGVLSMSSATISRANISAIIDDTVIQRLSQEMAYVWSWWSGCLKRVGRGQNVTALLLVVQGVMYPLELCFASKQGREKKDKVTLAIEMLTLLKAKLLAAGIPLHRVPITADSWYNCPRLIEAAKQLGFTLITQGKGSYVFTIENERVKGSRVKMLATQRGWGDIVIARRVAQHATFGMVILVSWDNGKNQRYLMVYGAPLRAVEAVRSYQQRHKVEEFFKLLKSVLSISRLRLPGRSGAYATLGLRLLTFVVLIALQQERTFRRKSLYQILKWWQQSDYSFLHFHQQMHENLHL